MRVILFVVLVLAIVANSVIQETKKATAPAQKEPDQKCPLTAFDGDIILGDDAQKLRDMFYFYFDSLWAYDLLPFWSTTSGQDIYWTATARAAGYSGDTYGIIEYMAEGTTAEAATRALIKEMQGMGDKWTLE